MDCTAPILPANIKEKGKQEQGQNGPERPVVTENYETHNNQGSATADGRSHSVRRCRCQPARACGGAIEIPWETWEVPCEGREGSGDGDLSSLRLSRKIEIIKRKQTELVGWKVQ